MKSSTMVTVECAILAHLVLSFILFVKQSQYRNTQVRISPVKLFHIDFREKHRSMSSFCLDIVGD